MLLQYFPLLVFLGVALALGLSLLMLSRLLNKPAPYKAKQAAYECGFDAFDDARMPFDVRFYLVAILFIIFDLETAFLFPWAVAYHHIGLLGVGAMFLFLFILIIGFVYEWQRGALEWE